MPGHDLDLYFNTALGLAKEAGKIVKKGFLTPKNVVAKAVSWDFVTEYDQASEKFLISGLAKAFPTHKFIGEETVSGSNEEPVLTEDPTWVIDPIDGTTNFVHGFPLTCISIALAINKETTLAIVYNPVYDHMFTARKGEGAYLNGERIYASKETDISRAVVALELSLARDPKLHDKIMNRAKSIISTATGIRVTGSCALSLCYVALGSFEAYQVDHLHSWDVAAGSLIISEAGGVVVDTSGDKFDMMAHRILAAGTPEIAQSLASLIKQADGEMNAIAS
ncbi:hypothetical protein FOCC_FOCC001847 [Frankliniella occidentalis]|uniref:Inositol-1-monophosphatase n=1 Tax=Frankliniella occidentalis TaxID=133901 RepID=A0A6J1TBF8_FRAOC|nr:uncharacterized protein LOC113215468 [Frankliniella occidentalis]KAE8751276.1 hypothetical protein FOCC_FOCC001847 [Frankliniella occidentalis]